MGMPEHQRQSHGDAAELERHRKSLADQFGHREVLVLERRPEIAVRQRAKVASVLRPDRLIQAIGALQIRHDFGRQRLLLIERTARRGADQKKRERDDDEQGGNRAGQTLEEIAESSRRVYRLTARWTSEAAILKLPAILRSFEVSWNQHAPSVR